MANPLKGYKFRYCNTIKSHKKSHLLAIHIYSFRNDRGIFYVANVEEYLHGMHVVKFFLKNHAESKKKYNYLSNEGSARRVIYTCVEIGLEIFAKNPFASFGFIGSPTIKELTISKLNNSKRFRVYQYFAKFFFSPENFVHSFNQENSSYIILNKKYIDERCPNALNEITEMFSNDMNSLYLPIE